MTTKTIQSPGWLNWILIVLIGLLLATVLGCVSVPEGSPAVKQQALSFNPPQGKAGVYVIRPGGGIGKGLILYVRLDHEDFGAVSEHSYLFCLVTPGDHALTGRDTGDKAVAFAAEAGKNYYFTVKPGFSSQQMGQISEADGRGYVQKFKLSGNNRFEFENNAEQKP